jgi:ABC-type branched-subunit amino acid transport system ATPase component/ABC-type branched-subunit amino acid transport system permease subunit
MVATTARIIPIGRERTVRLIGWLASIGALSLLWATQGEATIFRIGIIMIFFISASGLHVLVNWAGELSLAQGTFVGLAALTVAKISSDFGIHPLLLLPLGVAVGVAAGFVLALVAYRAQGFYVAIVTLAAAAAIDRFFFTKAWLVRGGQVTVTADSIGGVEIFTARQLFPILAAVTLVTLAVLRRLFRSRYARAMYLLKEHPESAAARGINVAATRALAYIIAGATAGLAGGLTALWLHSISPQTFPQTLNLSYLSAVVVAGAGSLFAVGQLAVFFEGFRLFISSTSWIIAYIGGIGMVFVLTQFPGGVAEQNRQLKSQIAAAFAKRWTPSPRAPDIPDEALPPIPPRARASHSGPLLEIRDASVRFGGLTALDGVSLTVDEGTVVGLIGPNGAGKTTLFNAISGLQRLTSGAVRFRGTDITRATAHNRAAMGIGRTFQTPGLMTAGTALDNVNAAQHLQVRYTLTDIALRPWRHGTAEARLGDRSLRILGELGLTEHSDVPVGDLSFGVVRGIELASLLAQDGDLLLLDEPTTGLDAAEVSQLTDVVAGARSLGQTVFLVAHDVGFVVDTCDLVYVLAEGQLIFAGPPEAARQDDRVVDHYLGRAPSR